MFSQNENTQICALCKGVEFYLEDGFYFCSNCQTQNQDFREQVHDVRIDNTTRIRKFKLKTDDSGKSVPEYVGWSSWELYNFALIGISNELISLGADPDIKLTMLQLWSYYLSKLEVAFTSKTKKVIPKMSRRYHKRDAEIIYGKFIKKKKRRRQKSRSNTSSSSKFSSFVSEESSANSLHKSKKSLVTAEYERYLSQNSDIDTNSSMNQSLETIKSSISKTSSKVFRIQFNKRAKLENKKIKDSSSKIPRSKRVQYRNSCIKTQYAIGPDVISPLKLWAIAFLALRINNQKIYLSDVIRFTREGNLSYYRLDHLLPPEVNVTKSDINFLTQSVDFTHKGLRKTIATLAKFLDVNELPKPDIISLIQRYCQDLNLPRGISLYTERFYLSSPSKMNFSIKSSTLPNYEGRAMAYILVVFKILFGLDDITEYEISRVAEKINRIGTENDCLESKLFSFTEWQRYIECRKNILANLHFPTKVKYEPENVGNPHLYLRFLGVIQSRGQAAEGVELGNSKSSISQNLVQAMINSIEKLNLNTTPLKEMEIFPPSLTPFMSYISQFLKNENYKMPSILRSNFFDYKVGYMTHEKSLNELSSQCGINLKVVNKRLQFFEKLVPRFEQKRMPSDLKDSVNISFLDKNAFDDKKNDKLLDYTNKNRPCEIKINFKNLKYFESIVNKNLEFDESINFDNDDSFKQVTFNGTLNIQDSDSEDEDIISGSKNLASKFSDNKCLLDNDFCQNYNLKLYSHEKDSVIQEKKVFKIKKKQAKNSKGHYLKTIKEIQIINVSEEQNLNESDSDEEDTVIINNEKKNSVKKKNNSEDDLDKNTSDKLEELEFVNMNDSQFSILDDYQSLNNLKDSSFENEILFRPYKDYWMYHCIFSVVKEKNFELFEKELPFNFFWLLKECANIIEMTTEDLYEEVCLVEAYHLNFANKDKDDSVVKNNRAQINKVMKKW